MTKSKVAVSVLAALTVVSLAACSGSASNDTPSSEQPKSGVEAKNGESIQQGLPNMTKVIVDLRLALSDNDATKAKAMAKAADDAWAKIEDDVKAKNASMYGDIETQLGVLKAGTQTDKIDAATLKKAAGELDNLLFKLDPAAGTERIKTGAVDMVREISVLKDTLAKGDATKVQASAEKVYGIWYVFEHDVKAKDKDLYGKIEEPLGPIRAGAKQVPLDTKTLTDLTAKLEALVTPLTK